jgi:hypothetical protein
MTIEEGRKRKCTGPNYLIHVKRSEYSKTYTRQHEDREGTVARCKIIRLIIYRPIFQYKKQNGCNKCGNTDLRVLHFHHPRPTAKVMTVADMMNKRLPIEVIWEEIKKCDLLCSNCHAIETQGIEPDLDYLPTMDEMRIDPRYFTSIRKRQRHISTA